MQLLKLNYKLYESFKFIFTSYANLLYKALKCFLTRFKNAFSHDLIFLRIKTKLAKEFKRF